MLLSKESDIEVHYCKHCLHHFKEHRWPSNHPVYIKYKKDFPDEVGGSKNEDDNIDYDEEGNEIRIDVPENPRGNYAAMANVGDYSEDFLQNLAES